VNFEDLRAGRIPQPKEAASTLSAGAAGLSGIRPGEERERPSGGGLAALPQMNLENLRAGRIPQRDEVVVSTRYADALREAGLADFLTIRPIEEEKEDAPPGRLRALVTHSPGSLTYRALCGESLLGEARIEMQHVIEDLRRYLELALKQNMRLESAFLRQQIDLLRSGVRSTVEEPTGETPAGKCAAAEREVRDRTELYSSFLTPAGNLVALHWNQSAVHDLQNWICVSKRPRRNLTANGALSGFMRDLADRHHGFATFASPSGRL
jgi:hypothetical protein